MRLVGTTWLTCLMLLCVGAPLFAVASPLTNETTFLTIDTTNFLAQGLVTCSGPDCNFCSFMAMVQNVINWLVGISVVIATIGLAIAGYKLVYSQGNASAVSYAKSLFFNIITGIILIMAAWFMIDTLLKLTTGDAFGMWNQIDPQNCGGMYEAPTELNRQLTLEEQQVSALDYGPDGYLGGATGGIGPGGGPIPGTPMGSGDELALAGGGTVQVVVDDTSSMVMVDPFLGHKVQIHKNLEASLRRIHNRWVALGGAAYYEVRSVGGYRAHDGGDISNHSYGIALDINPDENPHCPDGTDRWPICNWQNILITDMDEVPPGKPPLYQLFIDEGWGWGGTWNTSKDPMHFSKARGEYGDMRGE